MLVDFEEDVTVVERLMLLESKVRLLGVKIKYS